MPTWLRTYRAYVSQRETMEKWDQHLCHVSGVLVDGLLRAKRCTIPCNSCSSAADLVSNDVTFVLTNLPADADYELERSCALAM